MQRSGAGIVHAMSLHMPGLGCLLSASSGISIVQVPRLMPRREQDAIESGLIKKVMLRKSDNGTVPADGDLVRWCWLPGKPG
jgi:hypothetical protein